MAYEKLALLASTVIRCGADCSEIVQDDSGAREALFASWDAMASCGISRRRNSISARCGADCSEIVREDSVDCEAFFAS